MASRCLPLSTDRLVPRIHLPRSFWAMGTDVFSPQDALALTEDLGIELNTQQYTYRLGEGSAVLECDRAGKEVAVIRHLDAFVSLAVSFASTPLP